MSDHNDDIQHERGAGADLYDVVHAMVIQMGHGQQFYALPVGPTWAIFWNGPVYIH